MVFDESGSGSLAVDGETVTGVLCCCIFVCGANERDDEFLDRVEELCLLVMVVYRLAFEAVSYIVDFICSLQWLLLGRSGR